MMMIIVIIIIIIMWKVRVLRVEEQLGGCRNGSPESCPVD